MADSSDAQDAAIIQNDQSTAIDALRAGMVSCADKLSSIDAGIASLVHMMAKQRLQPDEDDIVTLMAGKEYRIDRKGRDFFCVWSPSLVAGVSVLPYGMAGYVSSFSPGWNVLNYPDNTLITVALLNGATASVIFRATNLYMGSAV